MRVRYAVQIEGLSHRAAARRFGIDPRTLAKMMRFTAAAGLRAHKAAGQNRASCRSTIAPDVAFPRCSFGSRNRDRPGVLTRRKPILKNRTPPDVEAIIVELSLDQPATDQGRDRRLPNSGGKGSSAATFIDIYAKVAFAKLYDRKTMWQR